MFTRSNSMSRLLFSPCLAALLLWGMPSAEAQAWTQEAGGAYVKVSQSFAAASSRYDADGTVVPYNATTNGSFRDRSTYIYGEIGVTGGLTLVASVPYKRIYVTDETFEPTFERESFAWGTAILGARYDIGPALGLSPDGPTVLAANLAVGIPMGYTRNYDPAVGPGQLDLQATLDIGRSLYPLPAYVQAGLGYRRRTSSFGFSAATDCIDGQMDADGRACLADEDARRSYGDEFLFSAEGGVTLGPVLFQGLVTTHWSVSAPAPAEGVTVILPEGFELQRYILVGAGVTVYGPLDFGLSVQAFGVVHAQNTLGGSQVFVGLERKF